MNWPLLIGDELSYIIVGKEVCPDTKKEHYQGYVECRASMRLARMKVLLGEKTHLEPRKGTQDQAIDYCKKDGDFTEFGIRQARQGKRNDLANLRDMIKEKKEDHEIVEEITSFQALKCIDTMRAKMIVPHAPGVKASTRWIDTTQDGLNAVLTELGDYDDMSLQGQYWIGYTGKSRVVIVEDWNSPQLSKNPRLSALTRPGRKVINTKGGSSIFAPDELVIVVVQ